MDYSVTAKEILQKVGTEENVVSVTHSLPVFLRWWQA